MSSVQVIVETKFKLLMACFHVFFHSCPNIFVEERQHWITTAMINGEVYLFDCLFNGSLTPSAELQIAQLYKPLIRANGLLVSVVPIQQQEDITVGCLALQQHTTQLSEVTLAY